MAGTLLFILYCFEAGIFLLVIPWTSAWLLNPLLQAQPVVADVAQNLYVRGLVSGFGLVHLIVAVHEMHGRFGRQREA